MMNLGLLILLALGLVAAVAGSIVCYVFVSFVKIWAQALRIDALGIDS